VPRFLLILQRANGDDRMELEAIRSHAALAVQVIKEADAVQLDQRTARNGAERSSCRRIFGLVPTA
jgi:hypothetical protein